MTTSLPGGAPPVPPAGRHDWRKKARGDSERAAVAKRAREAEADAWMAEVKARKAKTK